MSFVTSAFLLGGALIAIPIAIHLMMRRQPQRLEFPALRLVREKSEANRRRFRLRQWLLLALRCAVIGLLALALARPSVLGTGALGGREAPVAAALVLDSSMRMDYRQDNRSRLDAAKEMSLWLVKELPDDSQVGVLKSQSPGGVFAPTRSAARQQIERLRVGAVARPLLDLVAEAIELVQESELPRKEIYVLTDQSAASWHVGNSARVRKLLDEAQDVSLYLIDVGSSEIRNVGLSELRLPSDRLAANQSLELESELIASDPSGTRRVEMFLARGDRPAEKRRQSTLTWQEGQRAKAKFQLADLTPGVYQGYLQLVGQDALSADDQRFFTFQVAEPRPVLIAAQEVDDAIYLNQALKTWGFVCQVVKIEDLANETLSDFAAVCLLDPRTLKDSQWGRLQLYADGGGGVAIFLGRNANLQSMNDSAAQEVLPGKLLRIGRDADHLAPQVLQHPALRAFQDFGDGVPWTKFPVSQYWQLDDLSKGVQAVIRFDNGQPALLEKPIGRGRSLTLTTPISDRPNVPDRTPWNLLPSGEEPWPFLVLMGEMATYLAGGADANLNYLAGQTAVVPLDSVDQSASVLLLTPRGDSLRQSVDPTSDSVVVTATDTVGNYRLRAGGEEKGIRRGFSVNLPESVSQLDRIEESELEELLGKDNFRLARTQKQLENRVSDARVGWKLFPFLMLLLALVMAGEHLLSNRFYQEAKMPG